MHLDNDNGSDLWVLTPAGLALVMAKNRANRLGFALRLLFYRNRGRFPPSLAGIDTEIVAQVARQLDVEPGLQDLQDRTWKRHRAEIRAVAGSVNSLSRMPDSSKLGFATKRHPLAVVRTVWPHWLRHGALSFRLNRHRLTVWTGLSVPPSTPITNVVTPPFWRV